MSTIEYTILQLQVERQLELTLLFYYLNHVVPMLTGIFFKHNFHKKWFHVLYQNKVNLSLTFTQRLVYQAHNCKMVN